MHMYTVTLNQEEEDGQLFTRDKMEALTLQIEIGSNMKMDLDFTPENFGWDYARAVRYHLKFAYHDTVVRVSRYTLGIDTSHDMAYMR